jgi:hypothetical protein
MDVAPFIMSGRTFVPVRYLAYGLGLTDSNISWNPVTQTVMLIKGSTTVTLTIGSTVDTVNGIAQNMDVAPMIANDRVMLPARWVAQAFGYDVGWWPETQQVSIFQESTAQGSQPQQNNQTVSQPPSMPAGFNSTPNIANNSITYTWNPVSGATSYNFYYWFPGNSNWFANPGPGNVTVVNIPNTFYTIGNLSPSQVVTAYVAAVNSAGEGANDGMIATAPSWSANSGQNNSTNINNPTNPLTLASAALPVCTAGQSYNYSFSASGGVPPYAYQVTQGTLPPGLTLSSNGTISGTSTDAPGTYNFTVVVTDSTGATTSAAFSISNPGTNTITAQPTASGQQDNSWVNTSYIGNLSANSSVNFIGPNGEVITVLRKGFLGFIFDRFKEYEITVSDYKLPLVRVYTNGNNIDTLTLSLAAIPQSTIDNPNQPPIVGDITLGNRLALTLGIQDTQGNIHQIDGFIDTGAFETTLPGEFLNSLGYTPVGEAYQIGGVVGGASSTAYTYKIPYPLAWSNGQWEPLGFGTLSVVGIVNGNSGLNVLVGPDIVQRDSLAVGAKTWVLAVTPQ